MAKRFINSVENVVPDLIQGISLDSTRVAILDPRTNHSVVVRASIANKSQSKRVCVVSGGGSGHEPMAGGYVGDGMLAAAVAGGVFASPSTAAISAMLDIVAPCSTGIVVIVMNYTGDRINFGAAVEQLSERHPDCPVHFLLVRDDIAIPGSDQPRGIAGTTFVLKVAGAAADGGKSFDEVVDIAERAARSVASYGVTLVPCTNFGKPENTELSSNEIGLGLGIHGEPGAETESISNMEPDSFTNDLLSRVCQRLDAAISGKPYLVSSTSALAIMVNNLGAVSQAEMSIASNAVATYLYSQRGSFLNGHRYPIQLFTGHYITSLQMYGISITVFVIPEDDNGEMSDLLRAPTACTAWTPGFYLQPPEFRIIVSQESSEPEQSRAGAGTDGSGLSRETETNILTVTKALRSHCDEFSAIDQKTGDGDFGDTVYRGCGKIQDDLESGAYSHANGNLGALFEAIAKSTTVMGGTSGALTEAFFKAAANKCAEMPGQNGDDSWKFAFIAGVDEVMKIGDVSVGRATMVDALKPAADALSQEDATLAKAANAAKNGYEATKNITTGRLGRSANVRPEILRGVPDPGAYAVSIALEVLAEANQAEGDRT